MSKKGEISPQNFQKFNMSAGARGATIREGPQGPSYTTAYNALLYVLMYY